MVPFISLVSILKHVVGITKHVVGNAKHVVTTISAFSFRMLLLDRILTHIVNHISKTSYHLQNLYCKGGYVLVVSAKPNLITCIAEIFLNAQLVLLAHQPILFAKDHIRRYDHLLDSYLICSLYSLSFPVDPGIPILALHTVLYSETYQTIFFSGIGILNIGLAISRIFRISDQGLDLSNYRISDSQKMIS